MRVLYVVQCFWPYIGGLETVSATLVTGLAREGYDFRVLTCREDPRLPVYETWRDIPIHRVDVTAALQSRDAVRLATMRQEAAAIVDEWRPDVVHVAFSPQAGYLALGAHMERAAPLIVSFHGWWPVLEREGPTLTGRLLESAAWITACSQPSLADVRAFAPLLTDRSSWIPCGADSATPPVALPDGAPLVVGLGRLAPEKGFDVLVRAFAHVRDRRPDVRLVLGGRGAEEGALRALATELGIADAVDFPGWVPAEDVPALLDRATVVAVPSREEGFGLTALESALRARPVVATRVGGLPGVVEDGVTGVLVPPEAPEELAAAIGSLLDDRGRAASLGDAAPARARRLFSEGRMLREHDELYRRLGAQTAAPVPGARV